VAQAALNDLTQRAGFVAGTASEGHGTLPHSEVHYRPGDIAQGELLLNYLPSNTALVPDNSVKGAGVELLIGRGFLSITLPSGGATASVAPSTSGGASASGPSSAYSGGDTYASGGGAVDASKFGVPAPKGSCR
jgi:hypothetical protein